MKRHKTHIIADQGARILEEALPTTWIVNSQVKDYGKDYFVEVADETGHMLGEFFLIQLKSTETPKHSKSGAYVTFYLESKYARTYSKIRDLPVFLVVVDVKARKGWYCFIQPVLLDNQDWKHQRGTSIRLATQNSLEDHDRLRKDLVQARHWLRARYPASVANAIRAKEEELSRIDPRFVPKITWRDGAMEIHMGVKEPVRLRMHAQDARSDQRLRDVIERGVPAEFVAGELEISGSAFFHAVSIGTVSLSPQTDSASLLIAHEPDLTAPGFRSREFPAIVRRGTRQIEFESRIADCPIRVNVLAASSEALDKPDVKLTIGFKPDCWEGKATQNLPYFHDALAATSYLVENEDFWCHVLTGGVTMSRLPFAISQAAELRAMHEFLIDLQKVRTIFARFDVNPTFCFAEFERSRFEVRQVFGVIENGNWTANCPRAVINATLSKANLRNLHSAISQGKYRQLVLCSETRFTLFGQTISLGRIAHEFSSMRVELNGSAKRRQHKRSTRREGTSPRSTKVPLRFVASKRCKVTMRMGKGTE